MSTTSATGVIEWGRERLRAGPWRGDRTVAYLNPVPGTPLPSPDFLRRCLRTLSSQGYRRVVTGALAPAEQAPFRLVGFAPSEELHLLSHDLAGAAPAGADPRFSLRRASRRDRPIVLALDAQAFEPFWQLDESGLDDAIAATPHTRFRVAVTAGDPDDVVGYAITGRAGRRGYLQRLAVRPDHQGEGLGTLLVADALRWLRRWRGERAMVNTQLANERALALYERLGFRREPAGLSVLTIDLP
ncbi:MAG TPA: GNAT family N-acetyltransferase [Acidimicrobiales bacterium]|nr:GNAT family N-acetyltransferase [Acidimicrobiales bacterium]